MHRTDSMSSVRFVRRTLATAAFFIGVGITPLSAQSADVITGTSSYGALVVADAHPNRHCHNLSKRTYCHKEGRLPQNWPPNTETPHNSGTESDTRRDCLPGSRNCAKKPSYGKG